MEETNVECHRALELTEILEHIFGFLEWEDLCSCRQVSKLWEVASRPEWKCSSRVWFGDDDTVSEFIKFVEETGRESYFCNFAFDCCDAKNCDTFWKVCGSHVNYLYLKWFEFTDVNSARNVLYEWAPNLTSLHLPNPGIPQSTRDLEQPEKWVEPQFGENWNLKKIVIRDKYSIIALKIPCLELLSHFPGLQTLELEYPDEPLDAVFKSINLIRKQDPSKFNLKRISLGELPSSFVLVGSGLLSVLTDSSLPLQHISMNLTNQNSHDLLRSVLEAHINSLISLELEKVKREWLDPMKIFAQPSVLVFSQLTKIVLHSWVFPSLSFLRFTPNLVSLRIYTDEPGIIEATNLVEMQNVRLEKLREFEYDNFIPAADMQNLINWLPGVESLAMPLDNATFVLVCQHWGRLTSLRIPDSCVDECVITGLDSEHVTMINDSIGMPIPDICTVPRPNITCLQHLQNLDMKPFPPYSLGYVAAKYGINELPNLAALTIKGLQVSTQFWDEIHRNCKARVYN